MLIDTKKLSRALMMLLIVCGIFMICSIQVDAAGQLNGDHTGDGWYDIRDYKIDRFG